MMWRGKDAVYNILGHLVFVVPNELPIIAYRELPSKGVANTPPDPPTAGGLDPPPPPPPCGTRLPGVRAVCEILGGGCCG